MKKGRFLAYIVVLFAMAFIIWTTVAAQQVPGDAHDLHSSDQTTQAQNLGVAPRPGSGLFAYVNQPWDWVQGTTSSGAVVQASLVRNGSQVASAQTTTDLYGNFALLFVQNQNPVDILNGDQVLISDGSNSATITVIPISGAIDVVNDSVSGIMEGGSFPTNAVVGVSRPSDPNFTEKLVGVAADGTFSASFAGQVDLLDGYVAKVVYLDPNGNQVRKILYSTGLDVRVRINEDIVEGVTVPGTQVQISLKDHNGALKGEALCTADRTGYYSAKIYSAGVPVDIIASDSVSAVALGKSKDLNINVTNHSQIDAANDRITGMLSGGVFPAFGRINLWNANTDKWYFKDINIDSAGNYMADFSGEVDVNAPDRVRIWYIDANGNEIASLTTGIEVGVSTTANTIWGYTDPGGTVHGQVLQNGNPTPFEFDWGANADGYFVAGLTSQVTLAAGDQVTVSALGNQISFVISEIKIYKDYAGQTIVVNGIPNSILHLEIRRTGASFWKEVAVGSDGIAQLTMDGSYTIQPLDRMDLNYYQAAQGITVHQAFTLDYSLFLTAIQK
jgi:hypothetical protein